jgi:cytoskeletal protein RodZ
MKHQWLAYLVVALLSIGAGVAIAGLPDNTSVDATIVPPATTTTTTTTEVPAPTTTVAPTTVPETTEPETTEPETTEPETTETTEPETTAPETTDSVPGELPERSDLIVVAANGSNVAGAAQRMATRLEEIGYVDVAQLNGSDIVEFSVVYYAEGFEEAALRLAEELDLLDVFVAPLEEAPAVADLPDDVELLVYVGVDRA